ncbi:MAG: tetratricopeptide repeat protein [Myxococcales bacterium]|nr:tetratricopeptide repeat protein [Myxococcales bacterium]
MRSSPSIRIALLLALAPALPTAGCAYMTKTDGRILGDRVQRLEEGSEKERKEFAEQLALAKKQVAELKAVLQQATEVVTRNSADLGLEVKELRDQISRLEGEIAELRNESAQVRTELDGQIKQFARSAGVDVPVDAKSIPEDRRAHYAEAYKALQAGDHSLARGLFRAYVKTYPEDDRAGDAQYAVGKSYQQQGRYTAALNDLRAVIANYPDSPSADDALYDMALAFWELRACDDARTALLALKQKFPDSALKDAAERKTKEWKKPEAGYCR